MSDKKVTIMLPDNSIDMGRFEQLQAENKQLKESITDALVFLQHRAHYSKGRKILEQALNPK